MEERGVKLREAKEGDRAEIWNRMERKELRQQKEEREEKIRRSKLNKWYGIIKEGGIQAYLKKGRKKEKWNRIARFRLGNKMRDGRYWLKGEENMYRVCEGEGEDWNHVLERCMGGMGEGGEKEGIEERVRRILAGDGTGEKWLVEIEKERKGRKG